jgi:adenosylhomocysteine nucleosidase
MSCGLNVLSADLYIFAPAKINLGSMNIEKTDAKRVLVTYAVDGELIELNLPGAECCFVRTGMMSAFSVAEAITKFEPDVVMNIGTAGTLSHRVGDVMVCRRFIDRDMHRLADLGLEWQIDTTGALSDGGLCTEWGETAVCNTGDSFMTDTADAAAGGDVIDMEAYAQAYVCRERGVPFVAVKFVTDVIGQNSVKLWEEKLADARKGLAAFFSDKTL